MEVTMAKMQNEFHAIRMQFVATILDQKKITEPNSPEILTAYKACEKHLASMKEIAEAEGKYRNWVAKAERMMRNFDHNSEYGRVAKKVAKAEKDAKAEKKAKSKKTAKKKAA
jgi:hypothetical protein